MRNLSLSCALLLVAGAAGAAEIVSPKPVAPSSEDVVAAALDANEAIAARVAAGHARAENKDALAFVERQMAEIAAAQDTLTQAKGRIWTAHPGPFTDGGAVMAATERAQAALDRSWSFVTQNAVPGSPAPYDEGYLASFVAFANMERATGELDKQAKGIMEHAIAGGDHEYGTRDLQPLMNYGSLHLEAQKSQWGQLKKSIESDPRIGLKEKAVFAMPDSRLSWDD